MAKEEKKETEKVEGVNFNDPEETKKYHEKKAKKAEKSKIE